MTRMADKSKIEWLDGGATWNVAYGCSKVSAGCKNCYAHRMISTRFPHLTGCETRLDIYGEELEIESTIGWDGRAHFKPERLDIPFHWRKPRRVFVCSMSDLFHESLTNEQVAAVFGVMAACPQHTFIVLTKRLDRALEWFEWISSSDGLRNDKDEALECAYYLLRQAEPDGDGPIHCKYGPNPDANWPLENVIICASVEDQPSADYRVPRLLQIPAVKRWVSVEPMLGPVRLNEINFKEDWLMNAFACQECGYTPRDVAIQMDHRLCKGSGPGLHLVICGAETGPGKRPFKDEWALDLRDQCRVAGTPFFFKKDGQGNGTLCGVEHHECRRTEL